MMSAAMMGATAFQKGLGAIHALSHPIGAIYHTHHGTTNAVVMQAVMRFNRSEIEDRFVAAARYFGIEGGFDGLYDFVGGLVTHLNIPKNLSDLGLRDLGDAELDRIVAAALSDPSAGNPRELTAKNTLDCSRLVFSWAEMTGVARAGAVYDSQISTHPLGRYADADNADHQGCGKRDKAPVAIWREWQQTAEHQGSGNHRDLA